MALTDYGGTTSAHYRRGTYTTTELPTLPPGYLHYQVHAVIRACASSSDGKAPGIYAPTIEGQEQCIRRAYEHAGIDPVTVTLVEGHGTGTPVGDATACYDSMLTLVRG